MHAVLFSGKAMEHACGILLVIRLSEYLILNRHNSVGAQDNIAGRASYGASFCFGQAADESLRRFATMPDFRNRSGTDDMLDASGGQ
jgi:hypothetical protein